MNHNGVLLNIRKGLAMAQIKEDPEFRKVDLAAKASRENLTRMLTKLFDLWKLPVNSQLSLLGLSPSSRAMLTKYRQGAALSTSRDVLDRAGWLLAIHKALRLLYPRNEKLRYSWVSRPNRAFENRPPLEVMLEEGIIGIAKVSRYLDLQRGH